MNDIRGGIYRFDQWTILYRFFDGGKDNGGRPNRNVMLTAWIPTQDLVNRNIDLLPIFHNKTFHWVQEHSKTIGIDRPFALSETIRSLEPLGEINATYKDFFFNLTDKDNDYNLFINNEQFTLEKKPSAFFEEKKRKKEEEERHKKEEEELAALCATETKTNNWSKSPKPPEPISKPPQKPMFHKFVAVIIVLFAVIFFIGIGILIAENYLNLPMLPLLNPQSNHDTSESGQISQTPLEPKTSSEELCGNNYPNSIPSKQAFIEFFRQLTRQKQRDLLDELNRLHNDNSQMNNSRNNNSVHPVPNSEGKPPTIDKESPQKNKDNSWLQRLLFWKR
jgi:hypothetical protein